MRELLAAGLWGMLAVGAGAQERTAEDAQTALARGELLEVAQGDPRAALEVYRALAGTKNLSPEVRAEAWLRAGLCHRRLGEEELARQAFQQASTGAGTAAERARALLAGGSGEDQDRLELRVSRAIDVLRNETSWIPELVAKDYAALGGTQLRWMGEAAVPFLVREVDKETVDLDFIARASMVLSVIGGAEARAFFGRVADSSDVLLKRAVLRGLHDSHADPVREEAVRFVDDADDWVRASAVANLAGFLSTEALLELVQDPSERVRLAALRQMTSMDWLHGHMSEPAVMDGVAAALERAAEESAEGRGLVGAALRNEDLYRSERVRRLFLRSLVADVPIPEPRSQGDEKPWSELDDLVERGVLPWTTDITAEDIWQVAHQLTARGQGPGTSSGRARALKGFTKACLHQWDHTQVSDCARLIEAGVVVADDWLLEQARAEDLATVAHLFARLTDHESVASWLVRNAEGRHDLVVRTLMAWLSASGLEEEPGRNVARILLSTQWPEAYEAFAELGRRKESDYAAVCFLILRDPHPASLNAAVTLLDAGPTDAGWNRNRFLGTLVSMGEERAADRIVAAYSRGLGYQEQPAPTNPRGLAWFAYHPVGESVRFVNAMAAPAVVRAFELALEQGGIEAWQDAASAYELAVVKGHDWYSLPDAVTDLLCRRALDCPDPGVRRDLIEWLLRDHREPARALALRALAADDSKVRRTALLVTPRGIAVDPEAGWLDAVAPLLHDEHDEVALEAIEVLGRYGRERCADLLVPLIQDDRIALSTKVIEMLPLLGSARSVPLLLQLIQHPNPDLREVACKASGSCAADPRLIEGLRQALDDPLWQIRREAERSLGELMRQETLKNRYADPGGTGSGERPAAERLREQTLADQPTPVRVAAIRALATLAVPESLPHFVELLGDADGAVSAAAAEALDYVNETLRQRGMDGEAPHDRSSREAGPSVESDGEPEPLNREGEDRDQA